MAMNMTGEVNLPADRSTVWAKLNDPEVLKACIPGCQELVKESDTAFRATTKLAYDVQANVGGKIAQLGSRLIDGVAKKMSDAFFTNFVKAVAGAPPS